MVAGCVLIVPENYVKNVKINKMGDYSLNLKPLFWIGVILVLAIWIFYGLIDWFFIEETIRSTKPITPKIELVIKNNFVDTVYVYRNIN